MSSGGDFWPLPSRSLPVIGLVWLGGLPFAVGVAIVAGLASFEFFRLALGRLGADAWLAVIASAALPVLPSAAPRWAVATALVLGISIRSWSWNALRGDAAQGAQKASALVSGTVFCGGSLLALSALRELEQGRAWVLCLLAAAAANDAAAYFGGRRFGRHHLDPGSALAKPGKAGGAASSGRWPSRRLRASPDWCSSPGRTLRSWPSSRPCSVHWET